MKRAFCIVNSGTRRRGGGNDPFSMRRAIHAEAGFASNLSGLSEDPFALSGGRGCAAANLARQELPA
jgi:hypothetical protein